MTTSPRPDYSKLTFAEREDLHRKTLSPEDLVEYDRRRVARRARWHHIADRLEVQLYRAIGVNDYLGVRATLQSAVAERDWWNAEPDIIQPVIDLATAAEKKLNPNQGAAP